MPIKIFVTGTDTGVGKTTISVGLLKAFARAKPEWSTAGLKPIASGAHLLNGCLYNEDALALQAAATQPLPYSVVNPFVFQAAIAPHIAAQQEGCTLTEDKVKKAINDVFKNYPADVYVIEGAGGWNVPLNEEELYSFVVQALRLPTLFVVGIKLGCINHATLTELGIMRMSAPLLGWVGNIIDPHMSACAENIKALQNWLISPCLGIVPYGADPGEYLDVRAIMDLIKADGLPRKEFILV